MKLSTSQIVDDWVGDESATLRIRLFRLMCVTICFLCLVVVLPMNLLQNLPLGVNLVNAFLGLAGGFCYWESIRHRHYFLGFFFVLIGSLNPIWFLNAGSEGSVTYYFFAVILYPIAIFEGWRRRILTSLVFLNTCGLLVVEHFVPSLTVPFKNPSDRVIDLTTGALCSCIAVAVVARLIVATYDREQRRLEKYAGELAESGRNHRAIFNATSDALLILDVDGRLVDANERMCAMFGCSREEALRLSLGEISAGTSPYSGTEAVERVRRASEDGQPAFKWRARRRTGELFWAEVAIRAADIAGQRRVIASFRDISLRVKAEEALSIQEERLRLALEASSQGWFDVNVQTGKGRASAEYARMLGLEPLEMDADVSTWMEALHPDDRKALENSFKECIATGRTRTMEYRRKASNDGWKWIRSTGKIVEFDAQGRALRMAGTHTDITELKQLEARLAHGQRLESVVTLAGGVAHDLNNILTPMLMATSVLGPKIQSAEDRELLKSLEDGARRGATIVRQLMTFSKSVAPNRVALDPGETVRSAVRTMRTTLPVGITVEQQVPDGLWSVVADSAQMDQVLLNLCTNAREAMPQGGTLTISAENTWLVQPSSTRNPWNKGGAFVVIAISDTGRGIPPEIVGRIFDPFFTTKEFGQTSGLGLSTVYGIVSGHGGNVTVESRPGRGSTFKVFLPATLPDSRNRPAAAS